jgi:ABC-type multidrug transport system fused ATPase/permease subunit
MFFAAQGVVNGSMSIGDLVLVNAFMLQLFIPLGFLGIVYRQIKYALADMDLVFKLLEREPEIEDAPGAPALVLRAARCASSTSISTISRSGRSCATSISPSSPARRSPWSATAAPASRRWPGSCSAPTTSPPGAS